MNKDVEVLFSEDEIRERVVQLGAEITRAFAERELCVLALVKGSLVFMADLVRRIPLDLSLHLVRVTSQRERSAGRVITEIIFSSESVPLAGRDVLLIDDVVDTGITLSYLLGHVHEHGPRSLKVCSLIDKPGERKIGVHPDWSAFTLREPGPDRFLVGYGLDWQERYAGLPFIGTIARPARP
jgi:hypoxanthine phosphoribosyltransferase